jgi:hypothetical protein
LPPGIVRKAAEILSSLKDNININENKIIELEEQLLK